MSMSQHITDLLVPCAGRSLNVRVHPKLGPFVEGLSAQSISSGESQAVVLLLLRRRPNVNMLFRLPSCCICSRPASSTTAFRKAAYSLDCRNTRTAK